VLLPFGADEARSVVDVRRAEERAGVLLSLADRCCLATAIVYGLPAVVSDGEWELLELPVDVSPFR
jgi:PIN domain nuclease of toxin-antitoxin system